MSAKPKKITKSNPNKDTRFPNLNVSQHIAKLQNTKFSVSAGASNSKLFSFDTHNNGLHSGQLIPLTKADNITIQLTVAPKKEEALKTKSGILILEYNGQSFPCSVNASVSSTEVDIKVYLKTAAIQPTDRPMLSLFADLAVPYSILAAEMGRTLHIQQQHQHSGNTTNMQFLCADTAEAHVWASFINEPHHRAGSAAGKQQQQQQHFFGDGFAAKGGSGAATPVKFSSSSAGNERAVFMSPLQQSQSLTMPVISSAASVHSSTTSMVATPPQKPLGLAASAQNQSPRRRLVNTDTGVQSSGSSSSLSLPGFTAPVTSGVSAVDGGTGPPTHPHYAQQLQQLQPLSSSGRPVNMLKTALIKSARDDAPPGHDTLDVGVASSSSSPRPHLSSTHSTSAKSATVATVSHQPSSRSQFGSLTEVNLMRLQGSEEDDDQSLERTQQSGESPTAVVAGLREEIARIHREIEDAEAQYLQEERDICAEEEASLRDSVGTIYASLLQRGMKPEDLVAEQSKVLVWEGVQRKKNSKKSALRLALIREEMASMRREGDEVIGRIAAEVQSEETKLAKQRDAKKKQQLEQQAPMKRFRPMTAEEIAASKARVQSEIDALRSTMSESERRVKEAALAKNKEEEARLQETVKAVYSSLLGSTDLSPSELLAEQEKVQVWENLQRSKLAKSVKGRRKATSKEVARILAEGREAIKALMIAAEKQQQTGVEVLLGPDGREVPVNSAVAGDAATQSITGSTAHVATCVTAYADAQPLSEVGVSKTSGAPEVDSAGCHGETQVSTPASVTGSARRRDIPQTLAGSEQLHAVVLTAVVEPSLTLAQAPQYEDQRIARIEGIKAAIASAQAEVDVRADEMLASEAQLSVEETAGLTASVSAVYASLLEKGLSANALLAEQDKVAAWEAVMRKKLAKSTAKRKAALALQIQELRHQGEQHVLTLSAELSIAIDSYLSPGGGALNGSGQLALDGPADDSVLGQRMREYRLELQAKHSTAQRELYERQLAVQSEIAARKKAIQDQEAQRLEAIRLEKERQERLEAEKAEAARVATERALEESENVLMTAEDEAAQSVRSEERRQQEEVLAKWQASLRHFEEKMREKLTVVLQTRWREYRRRQAEHRHATAIQRIVRGFLVSRRIAVHFRQAISLIEEQSALVIQEAVRAYLARQKDKFRCWDIIAELKVVRVLQTCLERREMVLLDRRLAANRKKKAQLAEICNIRALVKGVEERMQQQYEY